MSKGSAPRPIEVPRDEYESEYERIFGKKPQQDNDHAPKAPN